MVSVSMESPGGRTRGVSVKPPKNWWFSPFETWMPWMGISPWEWDLNGTLEDLEHILMGLWKILEHFKRSNFTRKSWFGMHPPLDNNEHISYYIVSHFRRFDSWISLEQSFTLPHQPHLGAILLPHLQESDSDREGMAGTSPVSSRVPMTKTTPQS